MHFKEWILPWSVREVDVEAPPLLGWRKFDDAATTLELNILGLHVATLVYVYEAVVSEAARLGSLSVSLLRFQLDRESSCIGINDRAHPGRSDRSKMAEKQLAGGFRRLDLDSGENETELMIDNKLNLNIASEVRMQLILSHFSTGSDLIKDNSVSHAGYR